MGLILDILFGGGADNEIRKVDTVPAPLMYYIDPAGNDLTGDGSAGNPWKTLHKAGEVVALPNNTIHINAGTYTETEVCNLAVGVNIEGEGVASNVISHVAGGSLIVLTSAHGTSGGQRIHNFKLDGDALTGYSAITVTGRGNVEIDNMTIVNFYNEGIKFVGDHAIKAENNWVHDCIMTNCSRYDNGSGDGKGHINISCQKHFIIENNTFTQTARGGGLDGYIIKALSYNEDVIMRYCTLTKAFPVNVGFDFAWESWDCEGGITIYNNDITGSLDFGGHYNSKGSYLYGVYIHDNTIGQPALQAFERVRGILLEGDTDTAIIERNLIKNVPQGILFNPLGSDSDFATLGRRYHIYQDIEIKYNIIQNIGVSEAGDDYKGWGIYFDEGDANLHTIDNLKVYNNVIAAKTGGTKRTMNALELPSIGRATNIRYRNNILINFYYSGIFGHKGISGDAQCDYVWMQNMIYHGNGNADLPRYNDGFAPTNLTQSDIFVGNDPLFVTEGSDWHLQAGSPAINNGLNVGETLDFEKSAVSNPPEIGALEYP